GVFHHAEAVEGGHQEGGRQGRRQRLVAHLRRQGLDSNPQKRKRISASHSCPILAADRALESRKDALTGGARPCARLSQYGRSAGPRGPRRRSEGASEEGCARPGLRARLRPACPKSARATATPSGPI